MRNHKEKSSMVKTLERTTDTKQYVSTSYGKKYFTSKEVMEHIAGKFQNLVQYKKYVIENNLQELGFPLNPKLRTGYPKSTDAILGNPEGTYRLWQKKDMARRKPWQNRQNLPRVQKAKKPETLKIVDICKELLDRKITLQTMKAIMSETQMSMEESKQIISLLLDHKATK